MLTFSDFCHGPGGAMCQGNLGINIDACFGWDDLSRAIWKAIADDNLLARVKRLDGVLSPGERVVLHAILHTANCETLADELSDGRTWNRMSSARGTYRKAVLACIARLDTSEDE